MKKFTRREALRKGSIVTSGLTFGTAGLTGSAVAKGSKKNKGVQQETLELDGFVWNPCTWENMNISGTLHLVRRVAKNGEYFTVRHNYQNAKASGTSDYNIASNGVRTTHKVGTNEIIRRQRVRYISKDRWANALIFENIHYTLSPSGELIDTDIDFEIKCKGQSGV